MTGPIEHVGSCRIHYAEEVCTCGAGPSPIDTIREALRRKDEGERRGAWQTPTEAQLALTEVEHQLAGLEAIAAERLTQINHLSDDRDALADALREMADALAEMLQHPDHVSDEVRKERNRHAIALLEVARAALDRQEQPLNNEAQQRRLKEAARELAVAYGLSDEEGMRRVVAALNAVRDADRAVLDRHTQEDK